MGVTFSQVWARLFSSKEVKLLILGLDAAGKTTILYKITTGEVVAAAATVGSNHEVYTYKNMKLGLIDIAGQSSHRQSWSQYFQATSGVILVIDSTDRARMDLVRQELLKMMSDENLKDALLLVYANKQDLPNAMSPSEVSTGLNLTSLKDRDWQIFGASALKGAGLFEGLDWLVGKLAE
ncbi:ADP-ribosylation factor family-domain-containing protein [Filobasidium floriforme]|uniref:ADP-ribosylation factor family-domain-containing protein n=1 Tax=Filobasidium floriforme TaxID=5210 RepID=UPI001E8E7DF5|nr:ADP-ribosylation factor family-domain-containing protein [Filobasidium floriforme]KAH8084051.1 ADP-ribosylation factor family-domain-containing protein [Filobasidium floriforme]